MNNNIYYILAALFAVYLLISIFNKRTARRRRGRKFMEGYERKDKRNPEKKDAEKKKP